MVRVRAVLFDLYETLVHPDWEVLQAGRAALATRMGAEISAMLGQWQATHDGRMRGAHGGLEGDLARVLEGCGIEADDGVLDDLARQEYANWARGVRLYPDTLPVLEALRTRGVRTAIVSNASREAGSAVYALGLDRAVDEVVISCDVGLVKPEPEIFRLTLGRVGVAAGQALFVDDLEANLDAARDLGLRTALIDRGRVRDVIGTHPRVRSLEELWPLLGAGAAYLAPTAK